MADEAAWVDELEVDVCWKLLAHRPVGRVAFVVEGEPVVLPVNHAVDGRTIVFRTAQTLILEALAAGAPVAFEVDDTDESVETGWSVLVKGRACEVVDDAERQALQRLTVKPWAPEARERWIRIAAHSVTGRAISRERSRPPREALPSLPAD
jgi:nitroimidazol reductase NimA-like FMN-containing flavoprotein (pyridoxamine 5'-phosphate oxidase superfamily)